MDQWKALDRVVTILASHDADFVRPPSDVNSDIRLRILDDLFTQSMYHANRSWGWTEVDNPNFALRGWGQEGDVPQHELVVTYVKDGDPPRERFWFNISIRLQGRVLQNAVVNTIEEVLNFLDHTFPMVGR
jgi:hypothetical protein